jgi:hypothetical protein
MKGFGVVMCILGLLIMGGGVIAYYADETGLGVAGMAFGVGLGALGLLLFVTSVVLQLTSRTAGLMIRFEFFKMRFVLQGELGSPEEAGSVSERTWDVAPSRLAE